MTAGNNGASTPEDDDPFGYLYADGQQAGATPPRQGGYGYPGPAAQPGVPRTSYNQVRTVGERQYGQQVPNQQAYGQQPGYGQQPTAAYAAPETYPGPSTQTRQVPAQAGHGQGGHGQGGHGGGRGGGPNTKGLLIGAIAVVAVVVIGIAAALMTSNDDKDDTAGKGGVGSTPSAGATVEQKPSPTEKEPEPVELPKQDAATLTLSPPASLAKDVPGAKGADGAYVVFNGVGGSAGWSVDVPEAGAYTMYITYSVPGKDAKTSLTINGGQPRELNMSNFAKAAEGDWAKGWTNTYAFVNLEKGKNDLKISCEQGDQCEAYLDQVWLEAGQSNG